LFVNGFNSSGNFELVELPNGSGSFKDISISNTIAFPGSVQWDGTYLALTDQATRSIYRYRVNGTKANLKGTVSLTGSYGCVQTWIARPYVYCADAGNEKVEVYKYPAGGSTVAILTGISGEDGVVSLRVR
jgi:hypothetical protein